MTRQTIDSIRRMIVIDAALASAAGLHVGEMAARFAVDPKTIRREIDVLRELVGPTHHETAPHANGISRTARHWYQDRRRRLFAGWASK